MLSLLLSPIIEAERAAVLFACRLGGGSWVARRGFGYFSRGKRWNWFRFKKRFGTLRGARCIFVFSAFTAFTAPGVGGGTRLSVMSDVGAGRRQYLVQTTGCKGLVAPHFYMSVPWYRTAAHFL